MKSQVSDALLIPIEEAERKAAVEEFLSLGGTFHELYESLGGVESVIKDRHGITDEDKER